VYNTHQHRVRKLTTDDQCSLGVLKPHLGMFGVVVESTPAGLHEKRIERHIQTLKDRKRAMLAGLSYKLPPQLEAEAYLEAINWINRIPNSNTGASSPHELMTKTRSFLPQYHFGQVGLFNSNDKKQNKQSEWGIFLSYGSNPRYLRAYLPLQNTAGSRRKFVPTHHTK
jgi:hypothetical protein